MRDNCTLGCPCGHSYTVRQWSDLRLIQRLSPVEVARHVISWPDHFAVEVRVCTRCGSGISRKTTCKAYSSDGSLRADLMSAV
jgi:hypothetical protein